MKILQFAVIFINHSEFLKLENYIKYIFFSWKTTGFQYISAKISQNRTQTGL